MNIKKNGVDNYYKLNSNTYYNPHLIKIKIIFNKYIYKEISIILSLIYNNNIISIINTSKNDNVNIDNLSIILDKINNINILDIACGNGLVTNLFNNYKKIKIDGLDPYFKNKYIKYNYSFQDIALGYLTEKYDICICCYGFHLLDKSWYYHFFNSLALITNYFIIITPSKKIIINHHKWNTIKIIRDLKITIIILHLI